MPTVGPQPTTIQELVSAISPSEPRFSFFRFVHSYGGGDFDPVLFFYTCPSVNAAATPGKAKANSIKYRMMYPLMKKAVTATAEKEARVVLEKKFEVEDVSEITEELVLEDLHPKVSVRQGFSRPKRPGKA